MYLPTFPRILAGDTSEMKIGVKHMPMPAATPIKNLGYLVSLGDVSKGRGYAPSDNEWGVSGGDGHEQSTESGENGTDTESTAPSTTVHNHIRPSAAK